MAAAGSRTAPTDYDLPLADDEEGLKALMRPCTGRVQLIEPAGRLGCVTCTAGSVKLIPATVWVHCGVHYRLEQPGDAGCTLPSPGDMPPMDRPGTGYRFCPLPRNHGEGAAASLVDVFRAQATGDWSSIAGRWVVQVSLSRDPDPLLRFCAASEEDARAWQRQLRMRTAPLWMVWARHVGVVGGGSGSGDAVGPTPAGAGDATRLTALSSCTQGIRRALADGSLADGAGVATSIANPEVHNLAVAFGPLVGTALAALSFGLKVFVAAGQVDGAVGDASAALQDVIDACKQYLLPVVKDLEVSSVVNVGGLLERLSSLVADVEEAAGEMHHLMWSRRQRWWRACSAVSRGLNVGQALEARMSQIDKEARRVMSLLPIAQLRDLKDAPKRAAIQAAKKDLPPLPPNVFTQWDDSGYPATALYAALLESGNASCVAIGAQGMGGVGKTVCCTLVAHRLVAEEEGRERFSDGVHWVQLSKAISREQVHKSICALATTLTRDKVEAVDLDMAVKRLHEALKGKRCLVVVDDVWDSTWVDCFYQALHGRAGSSLLFSTRQTDFADRWPDIQAVSVDVLSGAAAAGVLCNHAKVDGVDRVDRSESLVTQAVELCSGLALALAVMGALVREGGWKASIKQVQDDRDSLLSKSFTGSESYVSLWACLRISRRALGINKEHRNQCWKQFLALCVMTYKEEVPAAGLAALWGAKMPAVERIARKLQACSLVTLQGGGDVDGHSEPLRLSLHDLVVDFLGSDVTLTAADREDFNRKLLSGYCRRHSIDTEPTGGSKTSGAVRELWKLPMDNFIERALPRLLRGGGAEEELKLLLLAMPYIAWRVEVSGGTCGLYRAECRHAKVDVLDRVATVVEGALADQDLSLSVRLQQAAFEVAERFGPRLQPAVQAAEKPLLVRLHHSARLFLEKPALALLAGDGLAPRAERRVFRSDGFVRCMCTVTTGGATQVVLPQVGGRLLVMDEETGSRIAVLSGHTRTVTCVAVLDGGGGGDVARVVSGSGDKTLRVWDVASGTCVTTLTGHTHWVTCVAVVEGGGGGDAARVVSGSLDKTLRVWDVHAGTFLAVLDGKSQWTSSFSGKHSVPCIEPSLGSCGSAMCVVGGASFAGFVDYDGRCALVGDHGRSLRFFGAPPRTTVVCCVSPSCVVFGTHHGGVHVGCFFS